jgi:hypothetical protein
MIGPRVEAALPGWGEAVFSTLFGTGRGPARDAWVAMRRQRPLELVIRSPSPRVLGLPWELARDPDTDTLLALEGVALTRSVPNAALGAPFAVAGERLRVLMVISRPAGAADVGYQMIARPLVRRLEAVRGEVDLVVLRPPTLERLVEVLGEAAAAGEPFQVVHFDGHGILTRPAGGGGSGPVSSPLSFRAGGESGVVVFEKPTGCQVPGLMEGIKPRR